MCLFHHAIVHFYTQVFLAIFSLLSITAQLSNQVCPAVSLRFDYIIFTRTTTTLTSLASYFLVQVVATATGKYYVINLTEIDHKIYLHSSWIKFC